MIHTASITILTAEGGFYERERIKTLTNKQIQCTVPLFCVRIIQKKTTNVGPIKVLLIDLD